MVEFDTVSDPAVRTLRMAAEAAVEVVLSSSADCMAAAAAAAGYKMAAGNSVGTVAEVGVGEVPDKLGSVELAMYNHTSSPDTLAAEDLVGKDIGLQRDSEAPNRPGNDDTSLAVKSGLHSWGGIQRYKRKVRIGEVVKERRASHCIAPLIRLILTLARLKRLSTSSEQGRNLGHTYAPGFCPGWSAGGGCCCIDCPGGPPYCPPTGGAGWAAASFEASCQCLLSAFHSYISVAVI